MPILDGIGATKAIVKQMKTGPPVDSVILALTAFTSEEMDEECLSIGMKVVMHKPAKYDELELQMAKYWFKLSEA